METKRCAVLRAEFPKKSRAAALDSWVPATSF